MEPSYDNVLNCNREIVEKQDFVRATFLNRGVEGVTFKNCTFDRVKFQGCIFVSCRFEGCEVFSCTARSTKFIGCIFDSKLVNFSAFDSAFRYCDFRGCAFDRYTHWDLCDIETSLFSLKDQHMLGEVLTVDIIGYKKLRDDLLCTLRIPKGNHVFAINGKKCRTESAEVVAIEAIPGSALWMPLATITEGSSIFDGNFVYAVGSTVIANDFDPRYNIECGGGIHFFKTLREAMEFPTL